MNTILFLDLQLNTRVSALLAQSDIRVVDFSDIENEGLVWPNLLKRCRCLLVSGAKSLINEDPKLESLLTPLISTGVQVQVLCAEQPVDTISKALISGVQYHFGVDFYSEDDVRVVLKDIFSDSNKDRVTA